MEPIGGPGESPAADLLEPAFPAVEGVRRRNDAETIVVTAEYREALAQRFAALLAPSPKEDDD